MKGYQLKNDDGSISVSLPHTIFNPTTGATINLLNNTCNIINPATILTALTANFPGSPTDGDVVEIKFTLAITTVTYGGGTNVGGIVAPIAGSFIKFTYDSGIASWC